MADAPCEVWFYHLERTGLDQALPELLEKTLQRGWKAVVRTPQPERVEHLDGWLWSYREDSFLPHAPADEPGAARQPVLLTTGAENPNGADALFLVDGAEPGASEPTAQEPTASGVSEPAADEGGQPADSGAAPEPEPAAPAPDDGGPGK